MALPRPQPAESDPNFRSLWKPLELPLNEVRGWHAGPFSLFLKRDEVDWSTALHRNDDEDGTPRRATAGELPAGLAWQVRAFSQAPGNFILKPLLPHRAVVMRPPDPVVIPHGEKVTFFCRIPSRVQLFALDGETEIPLLTVPTVQLSDTWFGDNFTGELCYSLRTAACRQYAMLTPGPHHILASIDIENDSKDELEFTRLCLRTAHLSLFQGARHFWASQVRVVYRHKDALSRVEYPDAWPLYERRLKLLAAPSKRPGANLLRRTFGFETSDFR